MEGYLVLQRSLGELSQQADEAHSNLYHFCYLSALASDATQSIQLYKALGASDQIALRTGENF
jgi:hypothetical protein